MLQNKLIRGVARLVTIALLLFATFSAASASTDSIKAKPWGTGFSGEPVSLYTLTNTAGMKVMITNYGGTVTSIYAPDRHGRFADIALGDDSAKQYEAAVGGTYFGALIGRYANRIAKGHLVVDGKHYQLAINNNGNTLHGGKLGYDKKVWRATPENSASGPLLHLSLVSRDGDEHFPGTVTIHVTYQLTNDNTLKIRYLATTDKDTVLNLTNHSYFNLNGAGHGTILHHTIEINADRYTPIDTTSIPLGSLAPVAGTPFDFRTPTMIGARIDSKNVQLENGKGYDHNFVLNHKSPGDLTLAARVDDSVTGRVLEVYTTQPGIQFYSGNFLTNKVTGKGGLIYGHRTGFALETQHYPDSPNEPSYPTTLLKPGETYDQTTIYKFKTD